MSWLSNKINVIKNNATDWLNPIEVAKDTYSEASKLPGTWESISQNVYDMANGNVSANPFGSEASGWDKAAGGEWLSSYPAARTIGRLVGSWFAGGAGGAAGKAAVDAGKAYNAAESSAAAADALKGLMGSASGSGTGTGSGGGIGATVDEAERARLLAASLRGRQPLEMGQMFDPNYHPREQ